MPRDDDCAPPANANTALADAAASRPDSLQAKFAEWQKKKAARAAKKQAKLRAALDASAGAKRSSKAEAPDDAGAKDENDRPVAALAQPKLQPKKAYVAAAYASSDRAQDILDKVTSFFTTDAGFLGSVQSWLEDRGTEASEVTLKRVGDGEYPVELHSLWKEYEEMVEGKIEEYIALEGSSLGELFNLARDRSKEAYSDADMFIKLLSACTTFKFFVDMLQRAQGEGGFKFTTTTGLDPSYNV